MFKRKSAEERAQALAKRKEEWANKTFFEKLSYYMPLIIVLISTLMATLTPFAYSSATIGCGLAAVYAIMATTTDKNTPLVASLLMLATNPLVLIFGATKKYKIATSILAFVLFAFIIPGLMLSGLRIAVLTDPAVLKDQTIVFENIEDIASAAELMAKNVEDGKSKVQIIDPQEFFLSPKDKLGREMVKYSSQLLNFMAPEGLDMDYVVSLDEVLFQSHTAYILDKSILDAAREEEGPVDVPSNNPLVFGVTCGMDQDGKVLTLATLPKGIFGNYVRADWAAPLVKACEAGHMANIAK